MAALLRAFPVVVEEARLTTGAGFTVTGLPANFINRLLSNIPHPKWSKVEIRTSASCRCKVKTVLVPSEGTQELGEAVIDSIYGPHSVVLGNPYLGVTVAGHDPENLGMPIGMFSEASLTAIIDGTWGTTVKRIKSREGPLNSGVAASVGLKAGHWNDYLISALGYAPQL
eukprot:16435703-Heterocapsa_arctica.AAC.1